MDSNGSIYEGGLEDQPNVFDVIRGMDAVSTTAKEKRRFLDFHAIFLHEITFLLFFSPFTF
jgi:hypothetical protein